MKNTIHTYILTLTTRMRIISLSGKISKNCVCIEGDK